MPLKQNSSVLRVVSIKELYYFHTWTRRNVTRGSSRDHGPISRMLFFQSNAKLTKISFCWQPDSREWSVYLVHDTTDMLPWLLQTIRRDIIAEWELHRSTHVTYRIYIAMKKKHFKMTSPPLPTPAEKRKHKAPPADSLHRDWWWNRQCSCLLTNVSVF